MKVDRSDQVAYSRTRRPFAVQHPLWENVLQLRRRGRRDTYICNLTPAAAEDLGHELIQVARTARGKRA